MPAVPTFAVLTLLVAACSSTEAVSTPDPNDRTARTVTLAEGRFGYCGRTIDFPATVESLEDLLGPPSRTEQKANTIDTWDDIGVYAYREPGETLVTSINVALSWGKFSFSPTSRFMGTVQLPEGSIRMESTKADLRAAGLRAQPSNPSGWGKRLGRYSIGATGGEFVSQVYLAWRGPDPKPVAGPPLAADELFAADSLVYGVPMDMTLRELSHRGGVSMIRLEGSGRNVGPGMFLLGSLGEIARRRGYEYFVMLGKPEDSEFAVGFLHDEDADLRAEFPDQPRAEVPCDIFPHDYILDALGTWPDGGRPWPQAEAETPQPR